MARLLLSDDSFVWYLSLPLIMYFCSLWSLIHGDGGNLLEFCNLVCLEFWFLDLFFFPIGIECSRKKQTNKSSHVARGKEERKERKGTCE